jgi:HEAT repeat protein
MLGGRSNLAPARKSGRRLLGAVVVLSIGFLAIWWLAGGFDREPAYRGKPASYWLDLEGNDQQVGTGTSSVEAFKAMGPKAVPFLVKALKRKVSPMFVKLHDFADNHDFPDWLTSRLPDPDRIEGRRIKAAITLGMLGTDAAPAIPLLSRLLKEPGQSGEMIGATGAALAALGDASLVVLPDLVEDLKSTNSEVQMQSADVLGAIGPEAVAAIPALKAATETPNKLALQSARALWAINRETNLVLLACSNLLMQPEPNLQTESLWMLSTLGSGAKPLELMIEAALRDPAEDIRWEAQKALREVDPELLQATLQEMNQDIPAIVARLVQVIRTGDPEKTAEALRALAVIGPDAAPAVPVLIEILDRGDAPVNVPGNQFALAETLPDKRVTADSPGTVAQLRGAAGRSQRTWQLSRAAEAALAEIGPGARAAVPSLIASLRDHKERSVDPGCYALGRIGAAAHDAIPVLEDLLKSEDPAARLAAAEALSTIDPEHATNAASICREYLDSQATNVTTIGNTERSLTGVSNAAVDFGRGFSLSASVVLWRLHALKEPPVAALMEQVAKQPTMTAIGLLGEIGPDARAALPVLTNCFYSEYQFRRLAAIAIRKIDSDEAKRLGLPAILALP